MAHMEMTKVQGTQYNNFNDYTTGQKCKNKDCYDHNIKHSAVVV